MRHDKDTIIQANDLIQAMRHGHVAAFHADVFGLADRQEIQDLVRYAKHYHSIQEHDCNGTKTSRMEALEKTLEKRMEAIAKKYGLEVSFEGDPRGFVVKLHAPSHTVYNTWGGAESGYGVG